MKYEIGRERIINPEFLRLGYKDVILWDVVEVKRKQEMYVNFVSTKSIYPQGIRLAIDVGEGVFTVNGDEGSEIYLWVDTCPRTVKVECTASEGKMSVYNICDVGQDMEEVYSQTDSFGMIVEKEGNKILYRCNDEGFETNFDKLVFEIILL